MIPLTLAACALAGALASSPASAETRADINSQSDSALRDLYATNPGALALSRRAKAILIFPSIVKAGLVFGAAYGEGELQENNRVEGYFNSFSGSWGLQAGAQSFSYAVFLMDQKALDSIHRTEGWEVGVGPTVVVLNQGAEAAVSSTTLDSDAYAFVFNQAGLMAGVTIEGSKISRIKTEAPEATLPAMATAPAVR
jgi:lipid-binding SYLF domain-containing protein